MNWMNGEQMTRLGLKGQLHWVKCWNQTPLWKQLGWRVCELNAIDDWRRLWWLMVVWWQTTNWVMRERKCWVNHWKSTQHFCISICGVFGFHVIDGWKELLMNQDLTDNGIGPEGAKSISESLRLNGKVWHLTLLSEWFILIDEMPFEKTKEHIYEWQATRLVMKGWNHWVKCWNWTTQ